MMKNNRGLTLIELLGVIIVLSIIAVIVTPTITRNLKKSNTEICYHELDDLITASKNWLTDQINDNYNQLFIDGIFQEQRVKASSLLEKGYVNSLNDKYSTIVVVITKSGEIYSYSIPNKSDYCE